MLSQPSFLLSLLLALSTKTQTIDAFYIVGGTPAADGEYPGYASPTLSDSSPILCGATLVHEDMLLTAAHCSSAFSVGETVFLGHNLIDGSDADDSGTVEAVRIHPNYNDQNLFNDVMLIKLAAPSGQPLVPMANADGSDDPAADCPVTAIGYGLTSTGGLESDVLLEVGMFIYSTADCAAVYGGIDGPTEICAGFSTSGTGTCGGDSGGVLFNGAGVQVGVVSFGAQSGCAQANIPNGFARVSGQRDFIDQAICDLSDNPPASCQRRLTTTATTARNENSFVPALCFGLLEPLENDDVPVEEPDNGGGDGGGDGGGNDQCP